MITSSKEISLTELVIGNSNVRHENIDEGIDDLATHIKTVGLIQPIVVYKNNSEKYEIISGQRRFIAFLKLNKEYPGKGFDKILCKIWVLENDNDGKAISLGEGLTQLPMTLADIMDACNSLFQLYGDSRIVAQKFGISVNLVNKYIKFARLPKLLQENLNEIHKNPKTAVNLAVEAVDALDYTQDGDVPEQKVYDLAKMLGEEKRKSQEGYEKLKQAAEENTKASLEKIEEISTKIRNPKSYTIVLNLEMANVIKQLAEEHGNTPEDEFQDLFDNFLMDKLAKK